MRTNTSVLSSGSLDKNFGIGSSQSHMQDFYEMQGTSPGFDNCNMSLHFGDSGYLTQNLETQLSSTNSEPSLEEMSLHLKNSEDIGIQMVNSIYFCENTVFDEPKLEGPPLLYKNVPAQFVNGSHLPGYMLFDGNTVSTLSDEYSHPARLSGAEKLSQDVNATLYDDNEVKNFMINDESSNIFKFSSESVSLQPCDESSCGLGDTRPVGDSSTDVVEDSEDEENTTDLSQSDVSLGMWRGQQPEVSTPTRPPRNSVNPDYSPELFSDDEASAPVAAAVVEEAPEVQQPCEPQRRPFRLSEAVLSAGKQLLRRVQETVNGVPPPPSVTILQISVPEMLAKLAANEHLFWWRGDAPGAAAGRSLLVAHRAEDLRGCGWPDLMNYAYHGLHFNRGRVSEDLERCCLKYGTLYVGAETASSCTAWATGPGSAAKRRGARRWGARSPGRRLSHLARRRITFSSSNLQAGCLALSVVGGAAPRPLLIDTGRRPPRRSPRKSPRKRTPRKSPLKRVRTPGSGSKQAGPRPGPSRCSSTKRALFQSPERGARGARPKRALFTSPGAQDRKRKRCDDDCHPSKFPRSLSFDVQQPSALGQAAGGVPLVRRHSEVALGAAAREAHEDIRRKKLLWAVSEALRSQQVQFSHPQFRAFGKVLCKVVQHQMPDILSSGTRLPGSTSERMLRTARQHVRAVVQGASYEQVVAQAALAAAQAADKPGAALVKHVLQDKVMNIEQNARALPASPDLKRRKVDENGKARIRRQIFFDEDGRAPPAAAASASHASATDPGARTCMPNR